MLAGSSVRAYAVSDNDNGDSIENVMINANNIASERFIWCKVDGRGLGSLETFFNNVPALRARLDSWAVNSVCSWCFSLLNI